MGSAVSWGDPQPLEWCAGHEGWEGGECNCGGWVLHLESWGGGASEGEHVLPWHWCLFVCRRCRR